MKSAIKKLARLSGYDVRRHEPNLPDFLRSRHIDTVIDVGANEGQFGRDLRAMGYGGRIISFEPVSSVYASLKAHAERDGNWEAHNYALGASSRSTTIKVSESSVFSSLQEQTSVARRLTDTARVLYEEPIEVRPLDELYGQFSHRRVFLKIDTQGFEREVLDGATQALKSIHGLQVELPVMVLYQNVWSLPQAIDYIMQRGFALSQTRAVMYDPHDPLSVVELDCIFRRSSE